MTLLATLVLRAPRVELPDPEDVAQYLGTALRRFPGLSERPGDASDGLKYELSSDLGIALEAIQIARHPLGAQSVTRVVVSVRGSILARARKVGPPQGNGSWMATPVHPGGQSP